MGSHDAWSLIFFDRKDTFWPALTSSKNYMPSRRRCRPTKGRLDRCSCDEHPIGLRSSLSLLPRGCWSKSSCFLAKIDPKLNSTVHPAHRAFQILMTASDECQLFLKSKHWIRKRGLATRTTSGRRKNAWSARYRAHHAAWFNAGLHTGQTNPKRRVRVTPTHACASGLCDQRGGAERCYPCRHAIEPCSSRKPNPPGVAFAWQFY